MHGASIIEGHDRWEDLYFINEDQVEPEWVEIPPTQSGLFAAGFLEVDELLPEELEPDYDPFVGPIYFPNIDCSFCCRRVDHSADAHYDQVYPIKKAA